MGSMTSETDIDEIHNVAITTQYASNAEPSVSATVYPDGFTITTNYGSSGEPTVSVSGFPGGTTTTTFYGPNGDPTHSPSGRSRPAAPRLRMTVSGQRR